MSETASNTTTPRTSCACAQRCSPRHSSINADGPAQPRGDVLEVRDARRRQVPGQLASIELQERLSGTCLSDEECAVAWEDAHVSGASAFRKTVDDLGGFYVKTGQIVASRQDLFPNNIPMRWRA